MHPKLRAYLEKHPRQAGALAFVVMAFALVVWVADDVLQELKTSARCRWSETFGENAAAAWHMLKGNKT